MHRDNGNVPIAQEISDDLQTKISWGFLTPQQSDVPF
jgi:hypothetical protein